MPERNKKTLLTGVLLAIAATILWAGNFVIARDTAGEFPPVSLAFYRWLLACILLLPFLKNIKTESAIFFKNPKYFLAAGFTGVTVFNTLVYVAGKYSTATNLALIGTTSSPVFSIILAAIFLKEKISLNQLIGMAIILWGITYLISGGSIENLVTLSFSTGDLLVLISAFIFAIYNILVRKRPKGISSTNFLFFTFITGTVLLLPFYTAELFYEELPVWKMKHVLAIIYIGLCASVLSFLFWNAAIYRLGAGRTSLFGNLILVFAAIEAMIFLNEKISTIQWASGGLILAGLIIANININKDKGNGLKKF